MARDQLDDRCSQVVVYLAYDFTDSSVIKRATMFQDVGLRVQGIMFRRERVNPNYIPEWENINLGTIKDEAFFHRLVYLSRAMLSIWIRRRTIPNPSLIYARNLDLAIIGMFLQIILRNRAKLVYEVLDVHKALVGNKTTNKILRFVERQILRRCTCLVVSSPNFFDEYFVRIQGYCGQHYIVENKLTPKWLERGQRKHTATTGPPVLRPNPPWVLGWFGTLRCPVSLGLLTRLAAALPDQFVLYLRGVPTDLGQNVFEEAIKGHVNIIYEGKFRNPEDLREIYERVHFNWCCDMVEPDANSKWLLPNRIYEGGYFNCPAIAMRGTATGQKVESLGLGHTLNAPYFDNLMDFFEQLTMDQYRAMVDSVAALPRTEFCDDAQFRTLLDRVLLRWP